MSTCLVYLLKITKKYLQTLPLLKEKEKYVSSLLMLLTVKWNHDTRTKDVCMVVKMGGSENMIVMSPVMSPFPFITENRIIFYQSCSVRRTS